MVYFIVYWAVCTLEEKVFKGTLGSEIEDPGIQGYDPV